MASKMPNNASLWRLASPRIEAVVVEVVAGVHADVGWELRAHEDFEIRVEEGNLDAADFGSVGRG